MIIHLLYYHAKARLDSETLSALFSKTTKICNIILVNNSCVLEISCFRGSRKTADIHEPVIVCNVSIGNVEFVEHNG